MLRHFISKRTILQLMPFHGEAFFFQRILDASSCTADARREVIFW